MINESCKVLFLTDTVEGKRHDKKLADESDYALPSGSKLAQDTGFQGFKPENVTILQPKKKPRGKELVDMDKHINQWLSSIRIRVEHAIGGVKRYRIGPKRAKLPYYTLILNTSYFSHLFDITIYLYKSQISASSESCLTK